MKQSKKHGRKRDASLSELRVSFIPTKENEAILAKYKRKGYVRSRVINKAIAIAEQFGELNK